MLNLSVVINKEVYEDGLSGAYPGDAGYDLRASIQEPLVIDVGDTLQVPLGITTSFDENYVGYLYSRSGLSLKGITLANGVGVVDSNYRKEWSALVVNHGKESFTIEPKMRICQVVFGMIAPTHGTNIKYCSELDETKRGTQGFGSSGLL